MSWEHLKIKMYTKWKFIQKAVSAQFHQNKKTTPNFIQVEVAECGATALAIILGYYKKFVSAEEIRVKCGVSRNGSKAVNILKAARDYGMIANGAQAESISELSKDDFPLIAFWEFNHFVVLEGADGGNVYINDPAQGPTTLTHETFNKSFTGVVLLLKPGPDFTEGGVNPFVLPSLKPLLKKYLPGVIFMVIISIAALIPAIAVPGASKIFVDDILIKQFTDWFRPLIIVIVVMGFMTSIISWLQQSFLLRLNIRLTSWLATRFVWHVLNLPLAFFASRHSGDILMRVQSIFNLSYLISGGLSSAIASLITGVFFLSIMIVLSFKLTLIILAMTFLGAAVTWFHKRYLRIQNQLVINSYNLLTGIEIGGLQSIEYIKASGLEFEFMNKRSGMFAKTMQSRQSLAGYEMSLAFSNQLITGLSGIILIGFASLMIMDGQLSIGTLIAFQALTAGFTGPLATLSNLFARIQEGKTNLVRLRDALNHPQAIETTRPPLNLETPLKGDILVENVSFSYSPMDAPILLNVDLNIPEGSTCAIVGKSGSGKSTLALLIAGLYTPTMGRVLVGNLPLDELDQETRRTTIGMIDADLGIFEGTLQDNITLFQPNISPLSLSDTIKNSCLEDVVEGIGGLQGFITENGTNLSGGQRQRIEIARVLLQNPKVLILDEATSALDYFLESSIYNNLKKMGYTLIIISHRLTSIQQADQIIVMDKGEIIDQGNHESLIVSSPHYKQLVSSE